MTTTNYLPTGYETLREEKKYINPSKLPEGEIRIRIVGRPIAGWQDWKDNKPYRYRPGQQPKHSFDAAKPMRAFWAMHVWDYAREDLFILDVTQNGIKKALEEYALNTDWGDLTTYDIKIKKEGSGKDTKYTVIPIPPKPMAEAIQFALQMNPVRLEALYEGKDPWKDLEAPKAEIPFLDSRSIHALDERQCAELDHVMNTIDKKDREKHENIIKANLKVTSIYDVPNEDFSRIIGYLEKVVNLQVAEANEQAKGA